MTREKYSVDQIETQGIPCKFYSMGGQRDGWIMPDGVGVDYAGYAQLRFEPDTITTDNEDGLRLARLAVANQFYATSAKGYLFHNAEDWQVSGDEWECICYTGAGNSLCKYEYRVIFREKMSEYSSVRAFNLTHALDEDDSNWIPTYSPWRDGGWYVTNISHDSGGMGCVSNNYPDKKWRIVCDERRGSLGGPGDFTFRTRDAAAKGERAIIREAVKQRLAVRPEPVLLPTAQVPPQVVQGSLF
ncbi:hypothetical protein [Pseudomonas sp. MWU12-2323]|uniref:hypothetical protein n=1 Tax=Pseudomonas sp. MWU12-2323 TaxID=2651296 RepID=UPI00128B22FE|nr:hypothetical protein [Pseudomonas sp. MWU12-2323]MPQ69439.1 hypothetical protein [Pseudomonas sp. MWU12-2323]